MLIQLEEGLIKGLDCLRVASASDCLEAADEGREESISQLEEEVVTFISVSSEEVKMPSSLVEVVEDTDDVPTIFNLESNIKSVGVWGKLIKPSSSA